MDLDKIIRELQEEREQLREAILAVERLAEARRRRAAENRTRALESDPQSYPARESSAKPQ